MQVISCRKDSTIQTTEGMLGSHVIQAAQDPANPTHRVWLWDSGQYFKDPGNPSRARP